MEIEREKAPEGPGNHLALAGAVCIFVYWIIESAVHSYVFDDGSLWRHIFFPDGHEIWMRMVVIALMIGFFLYAKVCIDKRKRIEQSLVENEEEIQHLLENNPAAVILIDCHTNEVVCANHKALTLFGSNSGSLVGRKWNQCLAEKAKKPNFLMKQRYVSEGKLATAEGKSIPVLKQITAIKYRGKPHFLEAVFDISEQKAMQLALSQAHAEMNQIFQTASVGMRLIDSNFTILKTNTSFSTLSGVRAEDAIGKKCFEVFAGNMCHTDDCPLRRLLDGRELEEHEVSKTCSDGSVLICNLTVTRFVGADGTIGIVESFRDVTEFKKIQSELRSERDLLHRILFHQFECVGILTAEYVLEYQNELLKHQTKGKDSCYCYQIFRDRDHPCDTCLMERALTSGEIQRFEFDTPTGCFQHTYTPFVDNKGRKKTVVSRRDITEAKSSIAAAIHSERLAALGELAAGVAHEINNPINGIINYAQVIANKTEKGGQLNMISNRIVSEGDRIAGIVSSLLSFSRQQKEKRRLVNIKDILRELLTLTGAQLRKDGILVCVSMEDNILPVAAAPQEVEQVFLNIINNSRYALNEKYPHGGDLKKLNIDIHTVSTERDIVIRICFTDFGTGIPPDVLEKVKNPFFSTKPKGEGTGLGLTISHRIVENHGGQLSIDSIISEYTKVVIDLPLNHAN